LQGSDGHGVTRLPQYARRIKAGGFNVRPNIRVVREQAATRLFQWRIDENPSTSATRDLEQPKFCILLPYRDHSCALIFSVTCMSRQSGALQRRSFRAGTVASTTMGTLYDLLGALPSDDAGSLRTAFRKAAKAKHPDINPGDPDAALKFRELVRAYDILMDADQRATYDELLTIALRPPPRSQRASTAASASSLPIRLRPRSFPVF